MNSSPVFILVLSHVLTSSTVEGLECASCHEVDSPEECDTYSECGRDQECAALQQHSVTWRKVYRLQCTLRHVCAALEQAPRGESSLCIRCCATPRCNKVVCAENGTTASSTLSTSLTPTSTVPVAASTHAHSTSGPFEAPSVETGGKYYVHEYGNIEIPCIAQGSPPPALTWAFNGKPTLAANVRVLPSSITVTMATKHNDGWYICTAENVVGKATGLMYLHVTPGTYTSTIPTASITKPTTLTKKTTTYSTTKPISTVKPPRSTTKLTTSTTKPITSTTTKPTTPTTKPTTPTTKPTLPSTKPTTSTSKPTTSTSKATTSKSKPTTSTKTPTTSTSKPTTSTSKPTTSTETSKQQTTAPSLTKPHVTSEKYSAVIEGGSIRLQCHVTGYPSPVVTWLYEGTASLPRNAVSQGSTLLVRQAGQHNAGSYLCVAQNDIGLDFKVIQLAVRKVTSSTLSTTTPVETTTHVATSTVTSTAKTSPTDVTTVHTTHPATHTSATTTPSTVTMTTLQTSTPTPYLITTHVLSVWHGDDVTLSCRTPSSVSLHQSWSLLVGTPASNVKFAASRLSIVDARPYNEGIYKCSAYDGNHTVHEYTHVYIKGIQPTITRPIVVGTAVEGERITMKCKATGHPRPTVYFENISRQPPVVTTTHDSSQRSYLRSQGNETSLVIGNSTLLDAGVYKCVASNYYGQDSTYTGLLLHRAPTTDPPTTAAPLAPTVSMRRKEVVLHGFDARLPCQTAGAPTPLISWYFNGSRTMPGNTIAHRSDSGSTLVVHKATPSDRGTYRCKADNRVGSAFSDSELVVYGVSPTITRHVQSVVKTAGDYLIWTCDASGLPRPAISWTFVPLLTSGASSWPRDLALLAWNTTLIIPHVLLEHQGLYTCRAENDYGWTKTEATLLLNSVICDVTVVCFQVDHSWWGNLAVTSQPPSSQRCPQHCTV